MDFSEIEDFASELFDKIGKYFIEFTLSPELMLSEDLGIENLDWEFIPYGPDAKDELPNDKRGIYAFIINVNSPILPPNYYVLYIGIAGRRSDRSLRARYGDYLNHRKLMKERPHIARMVATWHPVLKFFYASVEDDITCEQLEDIEKKLNSALIPTFSRGDLTTEVKQARRAFQ